MVGVLGIMGTVSVNFGMIATGEDLRRAGAAVVVFGNRHSIFEAGIHCSTSAGSSARICVSEVMSLLATSTWSWWMLMGPCVAPASSMKYQVCSLMVLWMVLSFSASGRFGL